MPAPDVNQILLAYQQGMSAPDIAVDLGYDELAVKAIITQQGAALDPRKPRAPTEFLTEQLFSKDDVDLAKSVVVDIASNSEVDGVKLKAATYIIDEAKGRHDVVNVLGDGGFSLALINEALTRARIAMQRTREKAANKEAISV